MPVCVGGSQALAISHCKIDGQAGCTAGNSRGRCLCVSGVPATGNISLQHRRPSWMYCREQWGAVPMCVGGPRHLRHLTTRHQAGCTAGNSGGRCLYVSGVPGTGKTATVLEVVRSLRRKAEAGQLPAFQFVELNSLRLPSPQHAYSHLYEVTIVIYSNKKACQPGLGAFGASLSLTACPLLSMLTPTCMRCADSSQDAAVHDCTAKVLSNPVHALVNLVFSSSDVARPVWGVQTQARMRLCLSALQKCCKRCEALCMGWLTWSFSAVDWPDLCEVCRVRATSADLSVVCANKSRSGVS